MWEKGKTTRLDTPAWALSLNPRGLNEHGDYLLEALTTDFDERVGLIVEDDEWTVIEGTDEYFGTTPQDLNNVRQVVGLLRGDGLVLKPFVWQHGHTHTSSRNLLIYPAARRLETSET